MSNILSELKEMWELLAITDIQTIKRYCKTNLSDDEKKELIDQYNKDFAQLPNDDKVKVNVLLLLSHLGITVY